MPEIFAETPRLVLRDWEEKDFEPYIQLNADEEVRQFFPSILSREKSLQDIFYIRRHFYKYGYGFFAVERKDKANL
jgi:RimJ/RimL family protein N-acetyltransferase